MNTALKRDTRDTWILENRNRIKLATVEAIAIEMRKLGLYSRKITILNARQALLCACRRLEVKL